MLAGSPNTGKSSLLNGLLREQRAIVTATAGTTRDVLREELNLNGLPVQLTDTAGLREASDEVERIGIDRAREELRGADVVLLVIDRSRPLGEEEKALLGQPGAPLVVALNKSDLDAVTTDAEVHKLSPQAKIVDTCAKTGEGVETLRQTLYETALRGA